jgi:hypothetical protein
MDYEAKIYGDITLQQTEETCESEQLGGFKLDSLTTGTEYVGGNVKLINKAAFNIANSASILTNLEFRELGADDPDNLRNQMKLQGWLFICDSNIYVEDALQRVLVFGKN